VTKAAELVGMKVVMKGQRTADWKVVTTAAYSAAKWDNL
jgi:hypothetical protein